MKTASRVRPSAKFSNPWTWYVTRTVKDLDTNISIKAREHEGTELEGHWGRWLWYVIVTKVIFSFRKSVFRDVRMDYNLDLRFLVKLKKQISMIVTGLS